MTIEIVRNDGRFVGRMEWLLFCDGELISHSGLYYLLEQKVLAAKQALRP